MKKTFYLALVAAFALAAAPLFSQMTEAAQAAPPAQAVAPAQTPPPAQTAPPAKSAPEAPPAQAAPTAAPAAQAPPAKPSQLRTELIKLKYLDFSTASNLLRAYSTTGRVSPPGGMNASLIVVTDTPEVVVKMLQVIKEYDVKPTEIQFSVQIVQGGEGETDEALRNDPVIKDLRGVLKYKGFTLLDGTILRVIEGESAMAKIGPRGEYMIHIRPKYIKDASGDVIQTEIWLRGQRMVTSFTPLAAADKTVSAPNLAAAETDLIRTTLMLKDGVKTVVGVSKSDSDRGLILILSAKVTK